MYVCMLHATFQKRRLVHARRAKCHNCCCVEEEGQTVGTKGTGHRTNRGVLEGHSRYSFHQTFNKLTTLIRLQAYTNHSSNPSLNRQPRRSSPDQPGRLCHSSRAVGITAISTPSSSPPPAMQRGTGCSSRQCETATDTNLIRINKLFTQAPHHSTYRYVLTLAYPAPGLEGGDVVQ